MPIRQCQQVIDGVLVPGKREPLRIVRNGTLFAALIGVSCFPSNPTNPFLDHDGSISPAGKQVNLIEFRSWATQKKQGGKRQSGTVDKTVTTAQSAPTPSKSTGQQSLEERLSFWLADCTRSLKRAWSQHAAGKVFDKPVWCHFTLTREGHIVGVQIVKSSGNTDLDASATGIVKAAAPLPGCTLDLPYQNGVMAKFDGSGIQLAGGR